MTSEKKAPPTSVWSRSKALLKLGASLGAKELGGRLSRPTENASFERIKTQVAQAKAIVESLGELKGAAMKAGQLLSMELRDILPPEVIAVLQKLQDSGSTVAFSEIEDILRTELGEERFGQLDVDAAPLASASIGQVHRAVWHAPNGDRDIVLKVQFRGIAETIDSDLAVLERIARLFLSVQFKEIDLGAVFTELKSVLKRETDYTAELQSLLDYRAHASKVSGFHVPEPYAEISTAKVLALSFEHGQKLDDFLRDHPTQTKRHAVAHQFLDLYFREFFEWGIVQTDANFANFLFRTGPGAGDPTTLVLLDFGATRTYEAPFRTAYKKFMVACFNGDRTNAIALAIDLKLIDPRESDLSKDQLVALVALVLKVFQHSEQPIDFTSRKLVDEAGEAVRVFYKGLKFSPPPAQLLFLHRKLGGIYSIVKALRGNIDLTPYWSRVTD
jgi:aarF domain-containing kinase